MVAPIVPILIAIGGQIFKAASTKHGQQLAVNALKRGGRVIKNTKKPTKPLTESVVKKMDSFKKMEKLSDPISKRLTKHLPKAKREKLTTRAINTALKAIRDNPTLKFKKGSRYGRKSN